MTNDELTFRVKWKGPDSLHMARVKAPSESHAAWKVAIEEMTRGFYEIELIEVTLEGFLPEGHPGQPNRTGYGWISGPGMPLEKG